MIKFFRSIKRVCDLVLCKFDDVPADKLMHDKVSMYMVFVFYVLVRLIFPSLGLPITTACLFAISTGIIKELIDEFAGNGIDVDDMIADAVGAAKGAILILVVTCVS